MRTILPSRRTRQPRQAPQINWTNPITQGLVFVWVPASDTLSRSGVSPLLAGSQGIGLFTNATTYAFNNFAPLFSLDNCSITALLTPVDVGTTVACAVSCGNSTNANPLFILGQSGNTANRVEFRTRDTANVDSITVAGDNIPEWASGLACVVTGTRSSALATQRVYAGGTLAGSVSVGTAAATTFNRFSIGGLLRSSFALGWSGTTSLVLIHNRALSPEEAASLSANPWQIFTAPTAYPIAPTMAIGGDIDATVEVSQAQSAGATCITGVSAICSTSQGQSINGNASVGVAITSASSQGQTAGAVASVDTSSAVSTSEGQSTAATASISVVATCTTSQGQLASSVAGTGMDATVSITQGQSTAATTTIGSAAAISSSQAQTVDISASIGVDTGATSSQAQSCAAVMIGGTGVTTSQGQTTNIAASVGVAATVSTSQGQSIQTFAGVSASSIVMTYQAQTQSGAAIIAESEIIRQYPLANLYQDYALTNYAQIYPLSGRRQDRPLD